jgi:alkylhydroperoxidase/carboxymuconolactone decarboxylase family protein YurZ
MNRRTLIRPKQLTKREWYGVLIATYFTVGRRTMASHIIERGIKYDLLPEYLFSELFLHLSLLLGFPTMLEGLTILRAIAAKSSTSKKESASTSVVMKRGRKTLERIYGTTLNRLLANLQHLHDDVPDVIVRDVYGRIIARRGLTLREREIINVVVLSTQRLNQQLYSHIRGALRLHVTEESLRAVIQTAARITRTSPRTSMELLSSLARPRKSSR